MIPQKSKKTPYKATIGKIYQQKCPKPVYICIDFVKKSKKNHPKM